MGEDPAACVGGDVVVGDLGGGAEEGAEEREGGGGSGHGGDGELGGEGGEV